MKKTESMNVEVAQRATLLLENYYWLRKCTRGETNGAIFNTIKWRCGYFYEHKTMKEKDSYG